MREYYEQRAPEYDDWWLGTGVFEARERPGWHEDVAALQASLAALPPARTLDVACGTGFLTGHLPGELTGLDQSAAMLEVAAARVPGASFVQGDALAPPFGPGAFERVHAGHFYGHLTPEQRSAFLDVAARLAGELVITDSALRPDRGPEAWDERASTTARATGSTSAGSPPPGSPRSWAAARPSTTAPGSSAYA